MYNYRKMRVHIKTTRLNKKDSSKDARAHLQVKVSTALTLCFNLSAAEIFIRRFCCDRDFRHNISCNDRECTQLVKRKHIQSRFLPELGLLSVLLRSGCSLYEELEPLEGSRLLRLKYLAASINTTPAPSDNASRVAT